MLGVPEPRDSTVTLHGLERTILGVVGIATVVIAAVRAGQIIIAAARENN
jgi:hypothetical protein